MQEGDIIIYRNNEAIATVPITPSAKKEWKLMEKDCCTLVFNVTEPIYFQIGDHISYGGHTYYISEEPLPADYSNGVYKHTLQFDRDYMLWKNITFQMTHIKHVDGTDKYVRTRNEVSWSLTDVLEKHIQELIHNVEISGAKVDEQYQVYYPPRQKERNYRNHIAYCVDGRTLIVYDPLTETFSSHPEELTEDMYFSGVESRKEMAFIQYNGTDLLSALKTICDTFHCEWWVKTITPNPATFPVHSEPYFVLCLGKCEYGDYIDFKMAPEGTDYADLFDADNLDIQDADNLDIHTADIVSSGAEGVINVEKMSLSRSNEEYANRLYVFGSTKNLPDTYRKKLEFEAEFAFMDETSLYGKSVEMILKYPVQNDGTRPSGFVNLWMYSSYIYRYHPTVHPEQLYAGDIIRYTGGCDARFACVAISTESNPDAPYTVLLRGDGENGKPTLQKDVEIVLPEGVKDVYIQNCLSLKADGGYVVVDKQEEKSTPLEIKRCSGRNATSFEDSKRPLSRSFLVSKSDLDLTPTKQTKISEDTYSSDIAVHCQINYFNFSLEEEKEIELEFTPNILIKFSKGNVCQRLDIRIYNITSLLDEKTIEYTDAQAADTITDFSPLKVQKTLSAGDYHLIFIYRYSFPLGEDLGLLVDESKGDGELRGYILPDVIETELTFGGNQYPILISDLTDHFRGFKFKNTPPQDFGVGSKFTIAEATDEQDGLSSYKVPSNYYSYDNGSINSVYLSGERRLQLPITEDYPEGIPYIDPAEEIRSEQLVEKVVIFEDIFPKCALRVEKVKEYVGRVVVETYADGSERFEETANYFIAVKRITDSSAKDVPFPFKNDMRIEGTTLQIKFLTQDEECAYTYDEKAHGNQQSGYQLSGLSFEVAYGSFIVDGIRYKGFQIARNNDFGAMFPNTSRKPSIGDSLVLSGWNVKAMQSLGLINTAENALLEAGNNYKDLLKNDLFTFDCTIMSDWMQSRINNDWVGQKARVFHRSLKDKDNQTQTKESRVIGYQMKLDIPYDSPILTVGETEAYSRIKALERALNSETRNASTGGAINASAQGGGIVTSDTEWYNLIPGKDSNGKLVTIIENYNDVLTDSSKYKILLLRWRKSTAKPHYHSWHAPFFSRSAMNNIAEADRSWPISEKKQPMFATTGDDYIDVLPLQTKQRTHYDNKYVFTNTMNRKMRFGCAIYKYTGEGTYGWQRVSNIAEYELFLTDSGSRLLSIRK